MLPTDSQTKTLVRRINRNPERAETLRLAAEIKRKLEELADRATPETITRAAVVSSPETSILEALNALRAGVAESEFLMDATQDLFDRAQAAERKRLEPQFKACDERMAQIEDESKQAHARVVTLENAQAEPVRRWKELMARGLLKHEIETLLGIPFAAPRPEAELTAERLSWYRERDAVWAGLKAEQLAINEFKRTLDELVLPQSVIAMLEG